MAETPKAPELTKPVDFIVPNQDLLERVIDARLAAHASNEGAAKKATSGRSTTAATPAKDSDKS